MRRLIAEAFGWEAHTMPFKGELLVWLITGALAGWLAGTVVTGKWAGLGRWTGLGIGLVGALIGGAIFRLFGIWPALDSVTISLRDLTTPSSAH